VLGAGLEVGEVLDDAAEVDVRQAETAHTRGVDDPAVVTGQAQRHG
jgi:hypothetical protein